jgi:hypothetical protein
LNVDLLLYYSAKEPARGMCNVAMFPNEPEMSL